MRQLVPDLYSSLEYARLEEMKEMENEQSEADARASILNNEDFTRLLASIRNMNQSTPPANPSRISNLQQTIPNSRMYQANLQETGRQRLLASIRNFAMQQSSNRTTLGEGVLAAIRAGVQLTPSNLNHGPDAQQQPLHLFAQNHRGIRHQVLAAIRQHGITTT